MAGEEHEVDSRYVLKEDFLQFRAENREQHGLVMIEMRGLTKEVSGLTAAFNERKGSYRTLANIGGILLLLTGIAALVFTVLK